MEILLICVCGMSTSMLAEKMKQAAEERSYQINIEANVADNATDIVPDYDVVLLAPQVSHKEEEIEKIVAQYEDVELGVIDSLAYGQLDGEAVLKQALNLVD
ncbi:PTS sugar transporter subunit IIB [Halanaerobacter jeridensis]|uniref:PTS system cellobiose-specific IIB component n=1 Tax=Halanaerobacter jeridensis TaxID=706427 RepID=A0A938XQU9_9FIRM|nr:PTS sugar transporter subunit IIB [Halanaerobacter jeridensis]MBM7555678.1 PTS system cellobiose-specific IIB component [Halanaerobacter jeridensis]